MLWAISLPVAAVAMAVTSASQVKNKLEKLFVEKKCMPIMVRLAWHDAGTYSKVNFRFLCLATYPSAGPAWCWLNRQWDKSGGATASIRFRPEIDHGARVVPSLLHVRTTTPMGCVDRRPAVCCAEMNRCCSPNLRSKHAGLKWALEQLEPIKAIIACDLRAMLASCGIC